MWKNVLLHAAPESVPGASASASYAASLAAAYGADLTALAFAIRIPTPFGLRTGVDRGAIDQHQAALKLGAEQSIATAKRLAQKTSVKFDDRIENCLAVEAASVFAKYARLADLTVIGSGLDPSGENLELVEAALFKSGRPVLVVPETGVSDFKCDTVAVAWNDTAQSARAMADAMPIIEKAKSVHVISVTDDDKLQSMMPSIEVGKYLAAHGVSATVSDTLADGKSVDEAIIAKAQEVGTDILVMGAYGHSRLREMILGGATSGILHSCPIPALMSH